MLVCPHVVLFEPQKSYSDKYFQEDVGLKIAALAFDNDMALLSCCVVEFLWI